MAKPSRKSAAATTEVRQYRTTQPSYRLGVLYQAGEVVTIPADEKPSKTWLPLEEEEAEAPAPAPAREESGARANDVSPV